MEVEEAGLKCGRCWGEVKKGDTYYLLCGGTVVNCENCACNVAYTIIVNGKSVDMTRAWDKVDKWILAKIRKVHE